MIKISRRSHWWAAGILTLFAALAFAVWMKGDFVLSLAKAVWREMGLEEQKVVLIQWEKNLDAVRYELEIFVEDPMGKEMRRVIYHDAFVHTRGKMVKEDDLAAGEGKDIYWRVRGIGFDGEVISRFSKPKRLIMEQAVCEHDAPVALPVPASENGAPMLYPVYAFIGNPDAVKFEVEVTCRYPENLQDAKPSKYRIYARETGLMDLYDEQPRIGDYYWRVRGLDAKEKPVGIWSYPEHIRLSTEDSWVIGIYGDSISHGGGHLSFSPSELEYSYAHYLDFRTINLSMSGNTSADMVERFERDVLPFRLKYLLIMGGTNSLRAGIPAGDVIRDLREIQEKCRQHHIEPILMTLPPINPASIAKIFDEPTAENWGASFREVNEYIRAQPHIDTAAAFRDMKEIPEELALDGLHGDWRAKQMMAGEINRAIRELQLPGVELVDKYR